MADSDSGRILGRLKSLLPGSFVLTADNPIRLLPEFEHPERNRLMQSNVFSQNPACQVQGTADKNPRPGLLVRYLSGGLLNVR